MSIATLTREAPGAPIAARPRRRLKVSGVRLLLLLVGLFLPLIALEAILRTFGPVLPGNYEIGYWLTSDPVYGDFHVRGARGWMRTTEYTTFFRTNQLGLRGPEVSQPKPPDVYRVLVVGDSFVEGAQVAEEQTLTQRLERSLNAAGLTRRVEVLNAGIASWGTGQEMLYLRQEGFQLQPDVVVLVLYAGNDIANNSVKLERQDPFETPHKPYWELDGAGTLRQLPFLSGDLDDNLLSRLRLIGRRDLAVVNFVERGIADKLKYHETTGLDENELQMAVLLAEYPPEWKEGWEVTEQLLDSVAKECGAAGSRFLTMLAPSQVQVVPDQ